MADWGMKISREGKDTDSTDPRDFVLWSKYKTPKTLELATTSISYDSGVSFFSQVSIAHGLGYAPMLLAFLELDTGKWYDISQRKILLVPSWAGEGIDVFASTDATNINFNVSSVHIGTGTWAIKYYLIIDPK